METQDNIAQVKSEIMNISLKSNADAVHHDAKDDYSLNSKVFEFAVQGISITGINII